ncbi:MAG: tetratricopeptide repeat protein [Lachnospiraceae bacterium]|nr:tetratricopeptide repeat protein [Lachnospiraceae bacterium]
MSEESKVKVGVYTTSAGRYVVRLTDEAGRILWEMEAEISPEKPYVEDVQLAQEKDRSCGNKARDGETGIIHSDDKPGDMEDSPEQRSLTLSVYDCDGRILLSYTKPGEAEAEEPLPDPAQPCEKPEDIETMEELYLSGLHLEQYRHATYRPEDYYREGLKRDPTDIRINNAYGRLLYNRGKFGKAEKHFQAAIAKATWKNPNPYDCEPYYNLGLALKKQGKYEAAYDAFYKAIWDGNMQDKGFYQLAALAAGKEDWAAALDFAEKSLLRGMHNIKARNLKTAILRLTGKADEARTLAAETRIIDPLDHGSLYELLQLAEDVHLEQGADMQEAASEEQAGSLAAQFKTLMRDDADSYLELAIDYGEWGLYEEAVRVLRLYSESIGATHSARMADSPMVHYYLAYFLSESGRSVNKKNMNSISVGASEAYVSDHVKSELAAAAHCACDYCFPVRLHDILALSFAIEQNPADANARYLLGNLYYDKDRWKKAEALWREAETLDSDNAIVHRNLALLYFNKKKDPDQAQGQMQKALAAAPDDARIFFEADQLERQMNRPFAERLKNMEKHRALLEGRDDLYTEYITLLNCAEEYEKALDAMLTHKFHPWEGGEGKIPAQYKAARIGQAQQKMGARDYEGAIDCLNRALTYPENFGEGKLAGTMDNDVYYFLGKAYEHMDPAQAKEMYRLALRGGDDLSSAQYYNDQPPEMFYYRALATAALGEEKAARRMLDNLFAYGIVHLRDKAEIDYFAVSLPDFLIFETDLERKNRVSCAFLAALGSYGLKEYENAAYFVKEGLSRDNAHQGLIRLKREMESLQDKD